MTTSETDLRARPANLMAHVLDQGEPTLDGAGEEMWIDVIAKMDAVYSDLLRYEADLEAKNAELEAAEGFISSVIASVSDILVVVDEQGTVVQANPAFLRVILEPANQVIGRRLCDLVVEGDRARARNALISGVEGEVRELELRFLGPEGASDLMAINVSARFDHNAHRVGAVLTGRPIGELRRAYEALHKAHLELQQAQKKLIEQEKMASLGRLVAGVAHELNNPISFVYGNIHTLERYRKSLERYVRSLEDEAPANAVQRLKRESRIDAILADLEPLIDGTLEGAMRISEIVKNLRRLSFARSNDRGSVDLAKLIGTAAHWAMRAKNGRAKLETDLEAGLTVEGEEGKIHQVLVNLVDNALDAVKDVADATVSISMRAQGEDVVVEVADNGAGLSDQVADKIFEPFFTTKVVGEGTGLGLWISYAIAREHGGSLTAHNGPTRGAVFQLRLPRHHGRKSGG
ncbi:MAG: ATP-binding protein [Hyphomicrobiales bacterium]|nr:ATP-binding protein [Hyphomicrobiales bacterium]